RGATGAGAGWARAPGRIHRRHRALAAPCAGTPARAASGYRCADRRADVAGNPDAPVAGQAGHRAGGAAAGAGSGPGDTAMAPRSRAGISADPLAAPGAGNAGLAGATAVDPE